MLMINENIQDDDDIKPCKILWYQKHWFNFLLFYTCTERVYEAKLYFKLE